jgi:hypothetical protein
MNRSPGPDFKQYELAPNNAGTGDVVPAEPPVRQISPK